MTNEEAHRLAREKGVSRPLYAAVKGVVKPALRTYFRMHVSGAEHVPERGRGDRGPEPQELLGLVLHRGLHPPPPPLHGQDRADRGALRAPAREARRLPRAPRPVRRGRPRDRAHDPAPGRPARPLPRGHAHTRPGRARAPQARRRAAGARGGRADRAGRDHGQREAVPGAVPEAAPRAGGLLGADRGSRAGGDSRGRRRGRGGDGVARGGGRVPAPARASDADRGRARGARDRRRRLRAATRGAAPGRKKSKLPWKR